MKLAQKLRGTIGKLLWPVVREHYMESACRKYYLEAIQLSEGLIKLSEGAQIVCDDTKSLVFFGIVLDSASKIRLEAKKRIDELKRRKGNSTFERA
jgi:hypothetical protein